jgi:type I restriction enzyme S subunit
MKAMEQKLVYKEKYKQTEVGMIPSDWEVKSLGVIGENIIGLTYSPRDVKDYGHLVLRSSNIQNNKLAFENNVYVDMELPQRVIVKENDILICVRNGSKNLIGKCALIDKKSKGCAFGAFMSIYRTDFSKYIFHQFQSNIIQKQIEAVMGATINQLTNKDLASFKIPLPPTLTEQTAIATALSDADAWISSLEKLIAKKRMVKQGAMQELLKPKEGWEVKNLGEIALVTMGQSPLSLFYNSKGNGLPLIQGNADIKNRKTIIRFYTSMITKKGKIGDIIMSVRAPVGEISKASFECCIGRGVCSISYENDFLYHYLIFFEKSWTKLSTGSTFDSVNSKQVKELEIPFPSIQEQTRIATILSDMDAELEKLEEKLAKAKQVKQGMMQELLTGRVRLI